MRFGSWVGGDRDGNPNVKPQTTCEVLDFQRARALRLLVGEIEELSAELSIASAIRPISPELQAQLEADDENFPKVRARFRALSAGEPYRQRLAVMHQRLLEAAETPPGPRAYSRPSELTEDLDVLARSLEAAGGALIANGRLARVRRLVGLVGFHLATLDIRQHAANITPHFLSSSRRSAQTTPGSTSRVGRRCSPTNSARPGRSPHPRRARPTRPGRCSRSCATAWTSTATTSSRATSFR